MASIFTFDPDPPRVSSPWSLSGGSTPQPTPIGSRGMAIRTRSSTTLDHSEDHDSLSDYGITKLDPEPQEGPTEYKLHLLLRSRRLYTSMSTGHVVGGSYHSRASLSTSGPTTPSSYETGLRPPQARSTQSRQQRLQQLTTQLLWRLQQSSPFHSSTTSNNPVLPVLPEMTQQGDPAPKPARLLPGLEESQGALYEIGVADDGTFVGLTLDELEESLSNLQIMAGSLGCKVDVLRRVIVGDCEWEEDSPSGDTDSGRFRIENLWVAEALVSPDLDFYHMETSEGDLSEEAKSGEGKRKPVFEDDHSGTEQIRVSITGPSTAGKSSLLGTLTSSSLDNGRGKSRLSLLKHRHEISSGVTSSVAQELIGYAGSDISGDTVDVINYASGNVAAWDDIHDASNGGRLSFVSDLPGSIRYSKSMLRGLVSWAPHYVVLCIPANCDDRTMPDNDNSVTEQTTEINLALSYLELCIKLQVPIVVAITKMDLASRAGLRNTLARILSALKTNGKKPAMLPVSSGSADKDLQHIGTVNGGEVRKVMATMDEDSLMTVPIVLTSAVDGSGIEKLHAFLRYLPIPPRPPLRAVDPSKKAQSPSHEVANIFDVDEVFAIPPSKVYSVSSEQTPKENQGVVLCGLVRYGAISIGDELVVGPLSAKPHWQRVRVVSVRNLRLPVRKLIEDQVGTIGIQPISSQQDGQSPHLGRIRKGTILASPSTVSPSAIKPVPLHTGFVATFPTSEFSSSDSPPLLLGGNAIVYIANIRTAVRVTCVELAENEVISTPPSPAEPEFFSFDGDASERGRETAGPSHQRRAGDAEVRNVIDSANSHGQEETDVHITFSFVTSLEWVEAGSRVLLMPGVVSMASASSSVAGSGGLSGLEGFVGRVRDVREADVSGRYTAAGSNMAESGGFMDSRIGSDIGPSSDEEDFGSTASVTSQKPYMDMYKEEEKIGECLMADQPKTKHSVEEEDIYSEPPSSEQNDTKQTASSTPTTGNTTHLQDNSDSTGFEMLKKPLCLLDLPVEILKEIMKQVTHTTDLTALALSCSRLHALAIPYMYSRFDIVWPESLPTTDPPGGVDALSYGLATLVMGEDIFHTLPPSNSLAGSCSNCGCNGQNITTPPGMDIKRTRRGNYFAQYTRKFSIGNGPAIWVKEYSVNKETGKLLGTLVALAVARMVNLEAFIWDMPTGVLKDVWVALASLADRPGHECRLEHVWVRWHNNSGNTMRSVRSTSGSQGISLPVTHSSPNLPLSAQSLLHKYGHVEYPTLSILPPLKSVSVLNIDEPSYLEELAVLIERSRYRLKELRIGMAHINGVKWQEPTGDMPFQPNTTTTWPKAGGVLEVLSGTFHNTSPSELTAQKGSHLVGSHTSQQVEQSPMSMDGQSTTAEPSNTSSTQQGDENFNNPETNDAQGSKDVSEESSKPLEKSGVPDSSKSDVDNHRIQLKLEVLELERVSIFVPAMLWTLDWTQLTTLTVLGCKGHEKLWRVLRRQYAPSMTQQNGTKNTSNGEFRLRIKNLHTDAVSPYLLLFIKDALAPNTLETVFLHERAPFYSSTVSIDGIYRNVLRRHRTSLKRVLVKVLSLNSAGIGGRWRKWMFNREVISFVTSGKMPRLRELSMAIDMKDWHFFVQQLPNIPHLRALHISNHNYPNANNQKELALQILDVITIRPEISLAYIGISDKCYEILECEEKDEDSDDTDNDALPHESWGESDDDYDDDDDDDDDLDDDDALSEDENVDGMGSENDPSSGEENSSSDGDESGSDRDKSQVVFKLREILFYDDKIGIFKSRRGDL